MTNSMLYFIGLIILTVGLFIMALFLRRQTKHQKSSPIYLSNTNLSSASLSNTNLSDKDDLLLNQSLPKLLAIIQNVFDDYQLPYNAQIHNQKIWLINPDVDDDSSTVIMMIQLTKRSVYIHQVDHMPIISFSELPSKQQIINVFLDKKLIIVH